MELIFKFGVFEEPCWQHHMKTCANMFKHTNTLCYMFSSSFFIIFAILRYEMCEKSGISAKPGKSRFWGEILRCRCSSTWGCLWTHVSARKSFSSMREVFILRLSVLIRLFEQFWALFGRLTLEKIRKFQPKIRKFRQKITKIWGKISFGVHKNTLNCAQTSLNTLIHSCACFNMVFVWFNALARLCDVNLRISEKMVF